MNINIASLLPKMLSGTELIEALTMLPKYDTDIRFQDEATRLIALSDLYDIYLPSQMSQEVYNKLYLALIRSLQKKYTRDAVMQQNQNFKAIKGNVHNGIVGGSDSFTVIGVSGIGKSSAINRAISLISGNQVIEIDEPYARIIPCVVVQCPFDCSVKGLLLEILRKTDEILDGNYLDNMIKARATTDMLIGSVSQIALNHIGLLIVDEIQNVCNSKNGDVLIGALTQLINNSGISICMVGTPDCNSFFEQKIQLARRSLGLQYRAIEYDDYFRTLCNLLLSYQYVKKKMDSSDVIINWLYEHSAGITSVVVSLIHDAQELAITSGKEVLDIEVFTEAYNKRLTMLHDYINPNMSRNSQTSKIREKEKQTIKNDNIITDQLIFNLSSKAKHENKDIVNLLREYIPINEVAI